MGGPTEERACDVGRKLRFLMETQHVTVQHLADTLGVTRRSLQAVLDGHAQPSPSLLRKLARHFELPPAFFGGEAPDPTPEAAPRPGPGSARPTSAGSLNLRTLAVRFQALVELLVAQGVIHPRDYQESIARVEERAR